MAMTLKPVVKDISKKQKHRLRHQAAGGIAFMRAGTVGDGNQQQELVLQPQLLLPQELPQPQNRKNRIIRMIIQQQLLLPSHPQFINQALLQMNVIVRRPDRLAVGRRFRPLPSFMICRRAKCVTALRKNFGVGEWVCAAQPILYAKVPPKSFHHGQLARI